MAKWLNTAWCVRLPSRAGRLAELHPEPVLPANEPELTEELARRALLSRDHDLDVRIPKAGRRGAGFAPLVEGVGKQDAGHVGAEAMKGSMRVPYPEALRTR